jgi:1-acyl-sn-glycerol-3-phosphate acyltransferase
MRKLWGIIATILSVLYTVILLIPATVVAPIADGHLVSYCIRLWCWLIFRTCGIRARVEGLEHIRGLDNFILVSNHQSLLDIIAVFYLIPRETRFIAKREIMKVPVFGWTMEKAGNVVIDRQSGGRSIRRALNVLNLGYDICVFAEGHRYSDNQVHDFNEGAAWLAIATKRPCVPMAITGTAEMMPRGARFVSPGREMILRIGKPIPTASMKGADRENLTRELQRAVRREFDVSEPNCAAL